MKISACIITFNEEENISTAIESVKWADEIVIVDSESTDKTCEIAADLGAKIIIQKWQGFAKQKQFAVDSCENDRVFSLDADEVVSEKLKKEILNLKETDETSLADGYKISRLTYYMNRPIRHCGWYPDWQLRFFNRTKGKWNDRLVHESFIMQENAKLLKLKADILHYSVKNSDHHNEMIGKRYAPLAAEQMFQNGKRTSRFKIATVGLTTFLQTYLLKMGFLDGFAGFCISRFAAHHAYLKHLLLWEKQNTSD